MSYKNLLNIIPVVQSAALVENSLNLVKPKKKKKFTKTAMETIVGASIIKAESDLLNT